ncbi:MAG TPA: hypothetical protein VK982_15560, partial [Bacteroidales bacterium]|nr:hypothetical protein [Bacteroidales bacterium]
WMKVGIQQPVQLVDIVSETSKNGNHFLAFYFENKKGERVSKTEWEVRTNKPVEQMDSEEKEAYLTKVKNQMARVSMIAKQFVDKTELIFEAPNFKAFADTIKQKLGDKYKGIDLRIKVVYDYNDWATLPSYVKFPWIERIDQVPDNESKIEILDIDKMKVKKDATNLNTEENPVMGEKDDLPF